MTTLPTGTITFLFTDIEGSTQLWEQHRETMRLALTRHDALLRQAIESNGGIVFKTIGDAFCAAFPIASGALNAALNAQSAVHAQEWGEIGPIRVRMALHTGEAEERDGDYFGPTLNRLARIIAAAHGQQVLTSDTTHSLLQSKPPPGITFHDCGIHRLRDVGEEHLWQALHSELPPNFAPLKTLNPERHNLPLPPTPFIGREEDIVAWHDLVCQPATRLVTLIGFGGIGKSRVALQLAERSTEDFEDGVWWVELQEVQNGEGIFQRISDHLRLHLQPKPSVREQVVAFLRERQMLFVLDNTEQIPDAAEAVNAMLHAAPRLKCLVTTRRALELRAEHLVEMPPLPADDAQRLFTDRARSRQAGFALTPENSGDVGELCRRLEGIPLAIELAATRIVSMTPRDMLAHLRVRFRLLHTRAPDLPPRQRALRSAIDWSYDLLTGDDQQLFAQLAVFAGGFTLEAAEAVCVAPDVFEGVMELLRHSLLRTETYGPLQQTRYAMMESVREYAAERLQALPDNGAGVWRRHEEYFLGFAERRMARMRTREEALALDELGREYDNLHAALRWAQENRQGELCARLTLALYPLLFRRGFWAEARRCLQTGREVTEGLQGADRLRATIECNLASIAHELGEFEEARRWASACLPIHQASGNHAGAIDALNLLGAIATDQGDMEEAQQYFEEALRHCLADDHNGRGIVLHNYARLASKRGQKAEAQRRYEEALRHRHAAGDARGEGETLGNLGVLAHLADDRDQAKRFYLAALGFYRGQSAPYGTAVMLNNLAELAELDDDLETAIPLFLYAERIFRELQSVDRKAPAESLQRLAGRLSAETWKVMRTAAEQTAWEAIVERMSAAVK